MPKLQILCGMISSGKSTYARHAAERGYVIVNDDAIVTMVHGGLYTAYQKTLKILYKSIENHIATFALAMKKTVVIDRGLNIGRHGRRRWVALGKSLDVRLEAVCFPTDAAEAHATRRCASDGRGHDLAYWTKVALTHLCAYELPSRNEGFDRIRTISWDQVQEGMVF